jgi:hypothetical protein
MKKRFIFIISLLLSLSQVQAFQNDTLFNNFKSRVQEKMELFKEGNRQRFEAFRNRTDSIYLTFLRQAWQSFNASPAEKSMRAPKPPTIPATANLPPVKTPPNTIPAAASLTPPAMPNPAPKAVPPPAQVISVPFYGYTLTMPTKSMVSLPKAQAPYYQVTVADFWEAASKCNLDGWFTFLLETEKTIGGGFLSLYRQLLTAARKVYDNDEDNARLLTWYLLVQKGYNIRIGINTKNVYLLSQVQTQIFGLSFYRLAGKPYYMLETPDDVTNLSICVRDYPADLRGCDLEVKPALGQKTDTIHKQFSFYFRGKEQNIDLAFSPGHISYFEKYPQLSFSAFNISEQGAWFDQELEKVFGPKLKGLNEQDKIQYLLSFVQSFPYKTDQQQFNREKWMFPEEILYYRDSDCDDRSILFAYLVRKLTGLPVLGLLYPDHICTAVAFTTDAKGSTILYEGRKYLICDPTYSGAAIGLSMQRFDSVKPEIYP